MRQRARHATHTRSSAQTTPALPPPHAADTGNNCIRRISGAAVTTLVGDGSGTAGYAGDGGSAATALLNAPKGLALAANGDLIIAGGQ